MMMKKLVGLALLGLVTLAPKATEAGTITYSASTIGPTLTELNQGWSFQQFDSNLGILTSVQLQIGADLSTSLVVSNLAGSASTGSVFTSFDLFVDDPGSLFSNDPFISAFSAPAGYSLSPGQTSSPINRTFAGSYDNTFNSGGVLAEFTGPGSISLFISTFTQSFLANSGGNTAASQTTFATLNGNVIYTYDDPLPPAPVPEPASMFLLGSGAVALVRMRRKQRAQ